MQSLQENSLESISLDVDTSKRCVKRTSSHSAFTKGLGLSAARRPSDVLRKVSIQRPISNDSIPSTAGSEFSDQSPGSRNSSMTSTSDSPVQQLHEFVKTTTPLKMSNSVPLLPFLSTPSATSTTSVNTLTPSQRYRLRRVNSSSSKVAAKLFDELNSDDETIEDGVLWNVPFTRTMSSVFNPVTGKSPALIRSVLEQSPAHLPTSPLPGSKHFYLNSEEAQSIAQLYDQAHESHVRREMNKRETSQVSLPHMINEASERGLDDSKLVSNEKLSMLSPTRPVWLPPKSSTESLKHIKDHQRMIEAVAKKEKKHKEEKKKLGEEQKKLKQKWLGELRLLEMQKLCFKCPLPHHMRYKVWSMALNTNQPLEDLNVLNGKLDSFPVSQITEIEQLTAGLFTSWHKFQQGEDLHDKLVHLLQLQVVSSRGLQQHDEVLLAILLLRFNRMDTLKLFQLLNFTVFTKECAQKTKNSLRSGKKYLPQRDYGSDLASLPDSFLQLLAHLAQEDIYPLLDILVLRNSYKVCASVWCCILKEHHLGFNTMAELLDSQQEVSIGDWFKFSDRLAYYYKKF